MKTNNAKVTVLFFETREKAEETKGDLAAAGVSFKDGGDPSQYGTVPEAVKHLVPLTLVFPTARDKDAFTALVLSLNPNLRPARC